MSGYRQSSFDPEAYDQPGRPLRPFNWVQWTGVALEVVGLGLFLLYIAGMLGWIAPIVGDSSAGFIPLLVGVALVNSRREPSSLVTSEQLEKNKRMLVITIIVLVAIFGVVALINSLSGA